MYVYVLWICGISARGAVEITLTVNDVMILCLTGGFIQFYMSGFNRLVQIQDTRNVCKYSSGPMDPEGIMFCFYYDYPQKAYDTTSQERTHNAKLMTSQFSASRP